MPVVRGRYAFAPTLEAAMSMQALDASRIGRRVIDGLSIRYAMSDKRERAALLLSPWPESIYAFEATWPRLAKDMQLVAIDLPGFGQSEQRDALMSPRAMGEFVVRVA